MLADGSLDVAAAARLVTDRLPALGGAGTVVGGLRDGTRELTLLGVLRVRREGGLGGHGFGPLLETFLATERGSCLRSASHCKRVSASTARWSFASTSDVASLR